MPTTQTRVKSVEVFDDIEALLDRPQIEQPATIAYPGDQTEKLPWLLLCNDQKCNKNAQSAKSDTAYLDGLRGFAALLVYSLHHQVWVCSNEAFRQVSNIG